MSFWNKNKSKKIPTLSPFLMAYMFRTSVSFLKRYVDEHSGGKDSARNDIIYMKYLYSKCHPVIRTLIKKLIIEHEEFIINKQFIHYNGYNHTSTYQIKIKDKNTGYCFKIKTLCSVKYVEYIGDDYNILINDNIVLTNTINDHLFLMLAIVANNYINDNIEKLLQEREEDKIKQKCIEAYK